ncbi:MAG: endonuclease/exonuclease/phosphatase family protein [Bacteroidia bacterium]
MDKKTATNYLKKRMKVLTTIFLMMLFACYPAKSQHKVDSSKIVSVLSFNIYHGETANEDYDLDVIARVIENAKPDFVALQEVDFKTNRAQKYDLATELAWRTKLIPLFGRAMKYDGGEYGEGILSKYTFLSSRTIPLPFTPGNEPRTALAITTIIASGDTVVFVGTHLDHKDDEKDRIAQAKEINKVFASIKYPVILAGDLNAIPGSTPINILEQFWSSSYDSQKPKPTYPSENPSKKIDYVMYYPQNRWRVLQTEVIQDSIASDHCAYLVTLELLVE